MPSFQPSNLIGYLSLSQSIEDLFPFSLVIEQERYFFVGSRRGYMNYYSGIYFHCFHPVKNLELGDMLGFARKGRSSPLPDGRNLTIGRVNCTRCMRRRSPHGYDANNKQQNEQRGKLHQAFPTNHFME
jgi:hypothetical protein